jgi:hypothetical protein
MERKKRGKQHPPPPINEQLTARNHRAMGVVKMGSRAICPGRDAGHPAPPAQIRTGALAHTAPPSDGWRQRAALPHTAHSLGHGSPTACRARARVGGVLRGLHPFLPNLRRRSLSRVPSVPRDSGAVRPLQAVHGRRTAFCLRGPVSVEDDPRQSGGLPVLGPVASRRAEGLRLRRAAGPLASPAARRGAFPLGGWGRRPGGSFRSSIAPPADALVYASRVTSRCHPQDSGSGRSRSLLSCRALASPATCRFIPAHPPTS